MQIPKTKKLFISYRSSDHREVDVIVTQLRSRQHEDGTPKYTTWQDKHDLKAGKSWWDGIVDAIIDCDMFIFHLSSDYLSSAVCLAELDYAVARGRPIIPIVLESAYYINPVSQKPDIDFREQVPEWLWKYQFLFYDDDDFFDRFERAVAEHEDNWPSDIDVRRPLNPDADSVHKSNYAVYASAIDYAQRVAFDDAKPLFYELVRRKDQDFADICRQWLTLIDRYEDLLDAKAHNAPRLVFKRKWEAYKALFPLDFVDDLYPGMDGDTVIFDPSNLAKQTPTRRKASAPPPTKPDVKPAASAEKPKEQQPDVLRLDMTKQEFLERIGQGTQAPVKKPSSESLLPQPFAWVHIPGAEVTFTYTDKKQRTATVSDYSIGKYPITVAQYRLFVEAGGYDTEKWWSKAGWQQRQADDWQEPKNWQEQQAQGDDYPMDQVSWYEAVAYCLWLSDVTGEKIMLPTEYQWRYAAEGKDGRLYPWGHEWDNTRCNNAVPNKLPGSSLLKTRRHQGRLEPENVPDGHGTRATPVTAYEAVGASPFGVIDMAGNVAEWSLTEAGPKRLNDVESDATLHYILGYSYMVPTLDGHISKMYQTNWLQLMGTRTRAFGLRIVRNEE